MAVVREVTTREWTFGTLLYSAIWAGAATGPDPLVAVLVVEAVLAAAVSVVASAVVDLVVADPQEVGDFPMYQCVNLVI